MKVSIKFQPQDLWVGVYWAREWDARPIEEGRGYSLVESVPNLSVWVCILPMLPIKFHFGHGEGGATDEGGAAVHRLG